MKVGATAREHIQKTAQSFSLGTLQCCGGTRHSLSIRPSRPPKTHSKRLTAAMLTSWQEFMGRPSRPLHTNRITDVHEFLSLQVNGTFDNLPADRLVYLVPAGDIPYVGRAKVIRSTPSSTLPGIAPRWSEHVRERMQRNNGTVDEKKKKKKKKKKKIQRPGSPTIYLLP